MFVDIERVSPRRESDLERIALKRHGTQGLVAIIQICVTALLRGFPQRHKAPTRDSPSGSRTGSRARFAVRTLDKHLCPIIHCAQHADVAKISHDV